MAKILREDGVHPSWLQRDWKIEIVGQPIGNEAKDALRAALLETHLGELQEQGDGVVCLTSSRTQLSATVLIREVLREAAVPADTLLRCGFSPTPTTLKRVYKVDRESNLEKIGKRSRVRPTRGDVFAYSFDKRKYFWGLVLRGDATAVVGEPVVLACFLDQSTSTIKLPAQLNTRHMLIPPLFMDDACWKRGLFLTVENRPVNRAELADYCFQVYYPLTDNADTFVDEDGNPRGPAPMRGSWGVSPWMSVDAELSTVHGVPLLA